MKAVIYARVSTDSQNFDGQLATLKEWVMSRGFELREVYAEQESAWSGGHQAELSRLLTDATRRKFDVVLVWALDRLSREGPLSILTLYHTLQTCGVKVLSYQESWTEAPGELAELLYSITGWIAKMESSRKSERVKLALSRPGTREKVGKRGPDKKKRKRRYDKANNQASYLRDIGTDKYNAFAPLKNPRYYAGSNVRGCQGVIKKEPF